MSETISTLDEIDSALAELYVRYSEATQVTDKNFLLKRINSRLDDRLRISPSLRKKHEGDSQKTENLQ